MGSLRGVALIFYDYANLAWRNATMSICILKMKKIADGNLTATYTFGQKFFFWKHLYGSILIDKASRNVSLLMLYKEYGFRNSDYFKKYYLPHMANFFKKNFQNDFFPESFDLIIG